MPLRPAVLLIPAVLALSACGSPSSTVPDASAPLADARTAAPDAALTAGDAAQASLDAASGAADASLAGPDAASGAPDASTSGQDASVLAPDAGPRGECQSPADCNGDPCVRIPDEPGGWYQCASPVVEQTDCLDPGSDECCKSSECTAKAGGGCFVSTRWYCGGVQPPVYNLCVYDECATSADCTAETFGVCVPGGAYGEARTLCSYGGCRFDADCTRSAGGQCRPFFDPCRGRFDGFWCTYPDGQCRSDADCLTGMNPYCAHGENGATTCEEWIPPP